MNWSEDQLSQHYANLSRPNAPTPAACAMERAPVSRRPFAPYRSKTEWRYAEYLSVMQRAGVVREWKYEAISLTLAPSVHYRPDFLVIWEDRGLEHIEVKPRSGSGYYSRQMGKAKIRIAASIYKFWKFRITFPGEQPGTWDEVEP